mmetsp:Transcript_2043/g.2625  ORF Transcript_2043/g.2625 Transcript_2043/m.2625 type:complete len:107 (-) Transcript_2043:952-1272(-)
MSSDNENALFLLYWTGSKTFNWAEMWHRALFRLYGQLKVECQQQVKLKVIMSRLFQTVECRHKFHYLESAKESSNSVSMNRIPNNFEFAVDSTGAWSLFDNKRLDF